MTVAAETHDVFLIHGAQDLGFTSIVRSAFSEAGLDVYALDHLKPDESFLSEFRSELAECSAFMVILTRSTLDSQNVAVGIGAAMAWNKPVYILYDGISPKEIPSYLRDFHLVPLSKLPQVVAKIAKSRKPLSELERETLVNVYQDLALATDQLIVRPAAVDELWQKFHAETQSAVPPKRLVEELMRLRKQGKLPRLSK